MPIACVEAHQNILNPLDKGEAIMAANTPERYLPRLLLAAFISMASPMDARADSARITELEARVEALEALVGQLLGEHSPPAPDPVIFETKVRELAETRVAEILEEHYREEQEKATAQGFRFGGFAKTNVIFSDYSGGPVVSGSPGRDFYIPGTLPVGGAGQSYLDYQAKESRINFRSDHALDNGRKLTTFVEVDFLLSGVGNERVSNSYNPRLRHAFFSYGNWLLGQSWTTLQNVDALPETLDFIGPSESTIFGRQVQVRYTRGPWQFSLENPETTITPHGGGSQIVADTSKLPDAVLRYNHEKNGYSLTMAGILRQLDLEDSALGIDDSATGYGISLSGHIEVGESDDFRWMASTGKGLGRYIGLNAANGAVLDANGRLEAIGSTGLYGAFHHHWNNYLRSNFVLGYLAVDNDARLTGTDVAKKASSLHLNLIYSPLQKLDFGFEYLYAEREMENGLDGDLTRYQFTAKYVY
jgi:hypothetical protein